MARLDYFEFTVNDIGAARTFYERAFGWELTEFGPDYAATTSGDTDIGLRSDEEGLGSPPLAVIKVEDLEAVLASIEASGGRIMKPIFTFPGGRRFHFTDPGGNELACWSEG